MLRTIRLSMLVAVPFLAVGVLAQPLGSFARTTTIELDGTSTPVDVYSPAAGEPVGMAIVAHGWTRSRERHRDTGRALANAGIVAVIPDLPNVLDLWGNGSVIVELVAKIEAGALDLPPAKRSSILLIGTSAGGLATVYAASKLPGIAGWIGLDPVDRTGTGMYAASKVEAPAIVLLGEPSACNLFSSGRSLARAVPRLVRSTTIEGASHCDFESPTNRLCTAFCGSSSRNKQLEAQDETVRAARDLLTIAHQGHHDDVGDGSVGPGAVTPPVVSPALPRDNTAD